MIIVDDPIVVFEPGKAVPPDDINRVFRYSEDYIADLAEVRYSCIPLAFQFQDTVNAQLTQGSITSFRTMSFAAPVNGVIQRAFVTVNGVFSDRVDVDITLAGTSTRPTGATTPYLSVTANSPVDPDGDISDINVQKVTLVAGQFYDMVVTTPAGQSYALDRLDVVLHIVIDAFATSGVVDEPIYSQQTPFTDGISSGDDIDSQTFLIGEAVNKSFSAVGRSALILTARDFHGATLAELVRRMIPQMDPSRATAIIERVYLSSSVSVVGGTVTFQLLNPASAIVLTLSLTQNAALVRVASAALNLSIAAGAPNTPATDFTGFFSTSRASPDVVRRAVVVIWIRH